MTVGNGDLFQVNSSGAITAVAGITTTGAYTQSGSGANTLTGGLTVTGATSSINASSNFATNINTGTSSGAISLGNSAAGAIVLQSASTIGLTATTSITGRSTGVALTVSNSTSTGNILVLNDNATAVLTVADGGGILHKNTTNSTTAFQIQNAAGTSNVFTADTTNVRIGIGTAAPAAKLHIASTAGTEFVRLEDTTNATSSGIFAGAGSPEGVVSAKVGSIYTDNSGGKIYVKSSGDGTNTGWVQLKDGMSHMAKMRRDTAQSMANLALTKVTLNTEEYDVGDIADPTTNNRFNIRKAGKYLINARVTLGANAGKVVQAIIYKNGARLYDNAIVSGVASGTEWVEATVTADLAVNDYLEMYVYHDNGAAQNTTTGIGDRPTMSVTQIDGAGGGGNPEISARAYNNATQSITTATLTALSLNSERYDTYAIHDTVTNNTRLTIPTTGKYNLGGLAVFASNSTGYREIRIRLNGSTVIASNSYVAVNGDWTRLNVDTHYQFTAGDYIELMVYQTSGGNLSTVQTENTGAEFYIARVDGGITSSTLQDAYGGGNTITSTDSRDLSFTLADTTTDSNFLINAASGTTGRFAIQAAGVDTFSVGPTGATLFKNSANSTTALRVQNLAGTNLLTVDTTNSKIITGGDIVALNASTATTGTTEATARTNVTTVTLATAGSFVNNDIIFLNNAGQKYYTRIVSGGGTTTLTVSPAVSYDISTAVTKYTAQNIGATTSDYTTLTQRFFQGYFLGGVVTGAGSTTLSDQNLTSTGALYLNTGGQNTRLTVTSAGDVGIGTTSPTARLTVYGAGSGTTVATSGSTDATMNGRFCRSSICTDLGVLDNGTAYLQNRLAADFSANYNYSLQPNGGNVGIGTTAPSAKLEVIGASATVVLRQTSSTSYAGLRVYNDQNSSVRALEIDYSGSAYSGALVTGGPTGESAAIVTTGNYPLALGTNNNVRLTILGGGNVGIGTNAPGSLLTVNGTISATTVSATNAAFTNYNVGGIGQEGNVYSICMNGSNGLLKWVFNITCPQSSDVNLKKNIAPIGNALDKLGLIKGVTFNWQDTAAPYPQEQQVGVIAQDVMQAFPQLIGTTTMKKNGVEGTYYTVNYLGLIGPTIQAVNELKVITDNLSNRLIAVESGNFTANVTVAGNATISGNLSVTGSTQLTTLKVIGITELADLRVNRIISKGSAPTVVLGATTTGNGSSYTVEGNDTAGSITVTTGTSTVPNPLSAGEQAELTFVTPFTTAPRITLTPTTEASANIKYYITKTGASFKLFFTTTPDPSSTYSFDYQVIQ